MNTKDKNRRSVTVTRWFIIIVMPLLLTLWTLRLLMTWSSPSYLEFEYGRIDPDRFGFTDAERLGYAEATLGYLIESDAAEDIIYLLEDLRLPNSSQPFYNEEEIGHMLDVKNVADTFNSVFRVLGIFSAASLIYLLARTETRNDAYGALMYGGLFTAAILLVMITLILVSWEFVFVQFHEVLFPPGTWTFSYSDSLIRLFPEQFWIDYGIFWTVGILVQGLAFALIGYLLRRSQLFAKEDAPIDPDESQQT